jgi:uncharacterized membrane protein
VAAETERLSRSTQEKPVKPKSMIAPMVILSLAIGAEGRVTAAGDQTAKPAKQGRYSLTQLDAGTDLASASVVQHMSDNGVLAGDALSPVDKSFAWSAQTGLVLLTLGGSHSIETAVSPNGIVTGASDTTGDAAVRGFVWTVAGGIAEIGNLGFSSGKKSIEDQHAVLWAPATPGGVQ